MVILHMIVGMRLNIYTKIKTLGFINPTYRTLIKLNMPWSDYDDDTLPPLPTSWISKQNTETPSPKSVSSNIFSVLESESDTE